MRKICILISMFVFCYVSLSAQNNITGKVTDSKDGTPLAGVTVRVKETGTSAITKDDGTFQIRLGGKSATLVFSNIGYAPEEVNVGSRTTNVNISLSTVEKKLQEVVVIAYGSQD